MTRRGLSFDDEDSGLGKEDDVKPDSLDFCSPAFDAISFVVGVAQRPKIQSDLSSDRPSPTRSTTDFEGLYGTSTDFVTKTKPRGRRQPLKTAVHRTMTDEDSGLEFDDHITAALDVEQNDDHRVDGIKISSHKTTAILDRADTEDVIGDFSKLHCLPVVRGKHFDLQCISPDTVRNCEF